MTVAIRAIRGDWGGAELSDIEAVACSAASSFASFDDDESVAIVLEPTESDEDPPIALFAPSALNEFVVRVNVRGNLWARLAYQFAHEFCHVIADPRTWPGGRFAWIEEALCETASLFALRDMARTWAVAPPYPNWRDYSASLGEYEATRTSERAHTLPPGTQFIDWLAEHLHLLEANPTRRDDNTVVAKELLSIFEADRAAWRAVRFLHTTWRPPEGNLADFMRGWAAACPTEHRRTVESIASRLDTGGRGGSM